MRAGKLIANFVASGKTKEDVKANKLLGDPDTVPQTPRHLADYAGTLLAHASAAIERMTRLKGKFFAGRLLQPGSLVMLNKWEEERAIHPEKYNHVVAPLALTAEKRLNVEEVEDSKLILQ